MLKPPPVMRSRRRLLEQTAGVALAAMPGSAAVAQAWPARPVRVVTQDAAGGGIDARLREFIVPLAEELKATLVVDNKVGASGQIAHQSVLTAPADGHTLLVANAAFTTLPTLYRKLPYSPMRDFTPVAYSGLSAVGLVVPSSHPARHLREWIEWAREHRGKLNYASGGIGSVQHLYGYQVEQQFGLAASHVPYKTVIQFLPDLVGGRLDFAMVDIFSLRPFIQRGDLRLLAVCGTQRSRFLPDVPTFRELGHAHYERMGWTAYFVRAGTPQPILERLGEAINKVNATPEWTAKREIIWSAWEPLNATQLTERMRAETAAWADLIRRTGVSLD
jgi:tripartite-type tricarboxylate transporter receptor subunit TctC